MMLKEIIVDDYGISLSKKSERMVLRKNGKVIAEYAIKELNDLVISSKCGAVSISLLEELIQNGTQIHFVDYREEPFVTIYTPAHHGSVRGRREQLLSFFDERSVELSKRLIHAKIQNQINVLKYFLKSRKATKGSQKIESSIVSMKNYLQKLSEITGMNIDEVRQNILTLEAHAAKQYWKCIQIVLSDKWPFPSRNKNSNDEVNMMLNYGYAILRSRISSSILRAGLEPYAGFIHIDRSGRPSLVLDVMEIFRPAIVDRVVISLVTRGYQPKLDKMEDGSLFLDINTLNTLRTHLLKRFEKRDDYRGKKFMIKTIIQLQTRELASYFRNGTPFKGYIARW
ncbi:CRISPR-associated protein Cas1 [Scopulibacillus daqui]|uniref:CRISPR-associated endonuclease Cas1 n=1 Tax=Scopulibacillus daqui TaxID=1469162 RepID=A0ABS2PXE8_9BACL|nr:CRISPR-associated endonuclease Cas1 [Scopulibacillus daqui]MBM7644541.1 CRISPR-associated protein Cas1 [Scopulibacillus daqui]